MLNIFQTQVFKSSSQKGKNISRCCSISIFKHKQSFVKCSIYNEINISSQMLIKYVRIQCLLPNIAPPPVLKYTTTTVLRYSTTTCCKI